MKITSVSYSRLVSLENYTNEKAGAEATVEEGESPEEALGALKVWVQARVTMSAQVRAMQLRANELQRQMAALENAVQPPFSSRYDDEPF